MNRMLCFLFAAASTLAAEVPTAPAALLVDRPLDWSGKIDGFIKAENSEVLLYFSCSEIVGIHKFKNDANRQAIIVLSRPLVMGRNDTFVLIPEEVMKFEKVVDFVDGVRKNRAMAKP